jgi:hypothetical protein
LDDSIVEEFNRLCDEAEANGDEPNRSLEGLLKFTRSGGNTTAEAGGEESEDGESEATERAIEVRIPTIFTMTYKGGDKNVSVRITEDQVVTTTNSREEILAAIEFLNNLI